MREERGSAFSNATPTGEKTEVIPVIDSRCEIPGIGKRINHALKSWGTDLIKKAVAGQMAVSIVDSVQKSLETQINTTDLTEARFKSLLSGKSDALPDTSYASVLLHYTNATPRDLIAHGDHHGMRTTALKAIAGDDIDMPMWRADIGIPKAYLEDFTVNQNARGKDQKVEPYGKGVVANSTQILKAKHLMTAEATPHGDLLRPTAELVEIVLSSWEKAVEDHGENPDTVVNCSFASVLAALVLSFLMVFGGAFNAVASDDPGVEIFGADWREDFTGEKVMFSVDGVQSGNEGVIRRASVASQVVGVASFARHNRVADGFTYFAEAGDWHDPETVAILASIDGVQNGNEGVIRQASVASQIVGANVASFARHNWGANGFTYFAEAGDWHDPEAAAILASIDGVQSGNEDVISATY